MFSVAFGEAFRLAFSSLWTNKLRAVLTLIGMVVGVTAVIAVVTVIEGLNQKVSQTFTRQGSNIFTINKMPQVVLSRNDFLRYRKRKDLTEEDGMFVRERCRECGQIGWSITTLGTIKFENEKSDEVGIRGITPSMPQIEAINIEAGRSFTEQDLERSRPVCLVGADIVQNLFPARDPLGKEILINGNLFTIIGIAERLGSIFGFSRDNFVMIPITTYRKIYGTEGSITIFVTARDTKNVEKAQEEARLLMRMRRHTSYRNEDDGFAVESTQVFLDLYATATKNIYLVSFIVSGISLVVGGIVIMNIMLVSVTERTREIGIRKALGARQRDILWQFLTEALAISAVGGMLGILGGYGLAYLISWYTEFPVSIQLWSAALGVGVSSCVGIIFGVYPANRAAQLDPIEALRAE